MSSPPFRPLTRDEDEQAVHDINAAKPDIVWVALGGPKQDLWMMEHKARINAAVLHGVGAAFDFLAGRVRQAPRWMMSAGFEWLFRLSAEPKRLWRRYTVKNAKFLYFLVAHELKPTSRTSAHPSL
jgi:N-acetylglucosaminyldiphosphoundecaprenol N-acetyl-beta-D-mannosaminyltransferase